MKGENPSNKGDRESAKPIPGIEMKAGEQNIALEKAKIVEFILKLYHSKSIQSDGLVPKKTVIKEFGAFVETKNLKQCFGNLKIGTLLQQNKFLHHTPRGSKEYCISMKSVFEFYHTNLELFDEMRLIEMSMHLNPHELTHEEPLRTKEPIKNLWRSEIAKEKIAEFVLNLYHDLHLQPNGLVSKITVWKEFNNFKKTNNYGEHFFNENIGKLLQENKLLLHTFKGSTDFRISFRKIFELRNQKLKELDENQKTLRNINSDSCSSELNEKPVEVSEEFCADDKEFDLVFQGGCSQQINANFIQLSTACFICQEIFKTQSEFEDHVSIHGFESDFEFIRSLKSANNIFEITYRLCNKSHYFCFTLKSVEKDVIIDKIIIVQTKSMHFLKNDRVPYELSPDGIDSFFVDSHLFTIGVEQPLIVIYRHKSDKLVRFVEEHHFLRIEEFPKVYFSFRSCRLPKMTSMKTKLKLNDYYPDAKVKASQRDNFSDESLNHVSSLFEDYRKGGKLNVRNVCDVLKVTLQIEDLESQKDYLPLYQKAAEIKRFGREYSVKLKKLPKNIFLENIVSILDEIVLTPIKSFENKQYFNAIVEGVYYDTICFQHESFIDEKIKYDIMLRPSRLSLKYQFRALEMLSDSMERKLYLFPVDVKFRKHIIKETLQLFNPSIKNNFEQLEAVRNIAFGPDVSSPYIIFGPPGTGKTSTIVETVLQLWHRRPETRVLITAGSNSACDEVALRLLKTINEIQPEKPNILRIYAKSNEKRLDCIEDALIEASNFYSAHFYPSVEAIQEYRIIVCTISIVGKLVSAQFGSDFFTHIFIDECGALTEPEALVAWMGTSSSNTRLILSGDHKQLGPILKSTRAASLGLSISLMERLLNSECYAIDQDGNYNRSIQTRLIRNYRSHPEIVALYNKLYYNNELKSLARKGDINWGLQWHMLPNRNYPIIFHSVYGNCNKNRRSISLCNEEEVNAVMDYVKDLMFFGLKGRKIEETDIGIISPYKKQYSRIQEELCSRGWSNIEVGAVETFQGKEKSIIIVSTVRSFTKTLGFLENPRRLNVVLSRAKALLIMIGNPKTLSQNKDYKFIIDECVRNQAIRGGDGFVELTSSIETNVNPNKTNSQTKISAKQRRYRKRNSKLKKVTNKENLVPVIEENSKTNDFKTICGESIDTYPKRISTTIQDNISNNQNVLRTPNKPLATVFPRRHAEEECITSPSPVSPLPNWEKLECVDYWADNYVQNNRHNYATSVIKKEHKKSTCILS
ncbi:putative helicase mov-10-B.1 [Eupeodes corollae]|uniref:putative helicase mov-10-B.1 n=1 Tax=Eupeodes corollae TaxID=290404 RepID=UPI0024921452|nr:putative helicase mov-10-B.1 [Eupeodes corollae]XP_055916358.1 putative helicase mov-10-B.1 [Eupeodes corollae]XP_055916359.1 putative helicase mov-10-B.1 [Eupeodes corollae]XP_055916360.1 putative helicase mov-10-B.1 [Eupeodes corollae]